MYGRVQTLLLKQCLRQHDSLTALDSYISQVKRHSGQQGSRNLKKQMEFAMRYTTVISLLCDHPFCQSEVVT